MKKSDYRGWKDVFRFSFIQGVKQKAYIGILIVMFVFALFGPVLLAAFSGNGDGEEKSINISIDRLMVFDEVGLPIEYEAAFAGTDCENVNIEVKQAKTGEFDSYIKQYEKAEDSNELAVKISYDATGYFKLIFVKAKDTEFSEDEGSVVADVFTSYFGEAKLTAIDVTEEEYAFINQAIETEVLFTDESGAVIVEGEHAEGISMDQYYVLLGGIMVCLMIITLSGSTIANSIVTEKSTRVVEYLMINVRPMALIVGKILSSLLLTVIQFVAFGAGYVGSVILQGVIFGAENTKSLADMLSIFSVFEGINPVNIVLAVLILFMGILFYSILAGLAGASVSKMDELAEGMKIYQMAQVVGSYIGIGICIMEISGSVNPMIINVCSMIPIATPFIVPATLLMGRVTTLVACIGFVLLAVITVLLYLFTANVYEAMIFYNGKVLKFKDILQIAKTRRKGDK